ncbi:lipocalin family protein [bacterium]|nr:lipocalin family protein [bacterium]
MNLLLSFSFLLLFAVGSIAQNQSQEPLEVVPEVDLNRYMGTWYEIARLPNWFQKKCAGDVSATYTLNDNGTITVVNRCRKEDGNISEAKGRAKRARGCEGNAKLKVRFAPGFLSVFPFVWGDYWIILLASDYSYAVIGDPAREYLWILSRTPQMDEILFQNLLDQIRDKGYNLDELMRTEQTER